MEQSTRIQDLQAGDRLVDAAYLLEEKQVRTTRSGSPYLSARLVDQSGRIEARYWNLPAGAVEALVEGEGVRVSGEVTRYQGQLQIRIDSITYRPLDVRQFLPTASRPRTEMESELNRRIGGVADPWLRRLLEQLLVRDTSLRARFLEAPAAIRYHHACLGGLLEHSLGVAALAEEVSSRYPALARDLLLTLALLHDLGKAEAYQWDRALGQTDPGRLLDHLYLGARRVERAIEEIPDFPEELRWRILHALLAHHGELEAGSPVRPQTLEAVVLHLLDKLDAHIRGFQDHLRQQADPAAPWTEFSTMFQARLYRGQSQTWMADVAGEAPGDESKPAEEAEWDDDALPF